MSDKYNKNDFELEEVKKFEDVFCVIRNIGQAVMSIVILAGLIGVFGFSIWTKQKKVLDNDTMVEYEYFLRARKEAPLRIFLNKNSKDSLVRIAINNEYFEKINIRYYLPEPVYTETSNDSLVFLFKRHKATNGFLTFDVYPSKRGKVNLGISVDGRSSSFEQFIYP
jgi:hypothetical protein